MGRKILFVTTDQQRDDSLGCNGGTVDDGIQGELYDLAEDPHQHRNLWDDPAHRSTRDDLVADLYDNLPKGRSVPLKLEAPA